MTTVVNIKVKFIRPIYSDLSDWMNDPQNEYIGRSNIVFINNERFPKKSSQWANPFTVKENGRDECLILYREWIKNKIKNEGTDEILKLKNKTLGCWCKPEKCHGDILIEILNELN